MKKIITLCLMAVAVIGVFAISLSDIRVKAPEAMPGGTDTPPEFYASMFRSDAWGEQGSVYNPQYGMYSIPVNSAEPYKRIFETSSSMVSDGGFYLDGKYYWVTSQSVGSAWMDKYASTYHISDAETFAEIDAISTEKAFVYGSDFTYDYIGGAGYAVGATSYSSADNPITSSELKKIDVSTGNFTVVGSNNARIKALACDGSGQLWGIGLPLDSSVPTNLYKIDKTTGAVSVVAEINKNFYSATKTSATFDLRDGKLYWSATTYVEDEFHQRTFESAIYEVNLATGAATVARKLDNAEVLVGMFLKDCHPKAPQSVKNLEFKFNTGSTTEGKVTFTLPEISFDHTALAAPLSAIITIDGVEHTVTDLAPGQTFEDESTSLSSGNSHIVTVTCLKGDLKSLPAQIEPYAGTDTPAAVTDIRIEASSRGDRAIISWTAPTTGASGGYINPERLTYTVIRRPEKKTIATNITDTQFIDELDRSMSLTQYEIKAVIDGVESESTYSGSMLLGTAYPIPYLETFDTNSNFLTYTVIDNNHDANDTDGGTWYWNQANFNVMYYTNLAQADDYLITPTLDLSSDKIYKLQFHAYGYSGGDCHFTVNLGNAATVEAQTHKILEEHVTLTKSISTVYTLFRPDEDECRISIRNLSDGSDHMYVDNILVDEYGSIDIPDVSTNLSAQRGDNSVVLTFTTPAATVRGEKLTALNAVKIYRAGELTPAATLDNVTPGTETSWTDNNPASGINQYIITAVNDEGDGLEAYVIIDTRNDIPQAVTDINITNISNGTEAEIIWRQNLTGINGGELKQSDITYDIYRNIGVYQTLVAENVSGLSYTDRGLTEAFGEKRQEYVAYTIVPQTNGGKGKETRSAIKLLGKSYDLPYKESWTNQSLDTYPWKTDNASYSSWAVASTGYDPYTQGQDNSGLATFSINRSSSYGQADYISPRIDISSHQNARITFYLFHSNSSECSDAALQVGINTEDNGTEMIPAAQFNVYASESGWQQHTVNIPDKYADNNRISLVFRGKSTSSKGSVHIDNVTVTGVQPAHEVKIENLAGPERCLIGKDNNYIVTVKNLGSENNGNITVHLYADGTEIGTEKINSIIAGASQNIGFFYTPGIDNHERVITISAKIDVENDESSANNESEITVSLIAPMLPYVSDLAGESHDSKAYLSWSDNTVYPHQEYLTDDVESYPEFAIDGIEGWTLIDMDKAAVSKLSLDGSSIVQWEHTGEPQAFIVFNTATAGTSSVIMPRSGTQCFISWESTASDGNDDWMISPQLSAEAQTISFYAKALYPLTLDEQFEVWVSYSTADDLDNFVKISGNSPVTVASATEWVKYSYQLPEGARYFAIRCVSKHQFGLMIDDITYSPAHSPVEFWGYNVYRDGQLITPDGIGDPEYIDSDVTVDRTYRYNVTALYESGETIYSNDVNLKISSLAGIDRITTADDITITSIPGGISVSGAYGKIINVYSINGSCICSVRGTSSDLIPLQSGFYVVSIDKTVAKVAVK